MSDAALRALERAVLETPFDRSLSERYLAELRRRGLVEPDDAPGDAIEPAPNPGIAEKDLVLVVRRARPRPAFEWRAEMDALVGGVFRVARVRARASVGARDGLSCLLEGPSLVGPGGPGHGTIGRSVGFASLRKLG